MASADNEHFELLPLLVDPTTKALSAPTIESRNPALAKEIQQLNGLHRQFQQLLESPLVAPGPPAPVKPQRSQQIGKLREAAAASMKKANADPTEAVRLYTVALDMAMQRPPWEPAPLLREELALLYSNRAQAQMNARQWPDALTDVILSLEAKKMGGQAKAYWRGARCLMEMGRLTEARKYTVKGVETEEEGVRQARNQLVQMQKQGAPPPQLQQVKTQADTWTKEVEELKELRKEIENTLQARSS